MSNEQIVSEISTRIHQLESLSTENLKGEMQDLKRILMENPAACMLMHDEDIGIMVSALRKITGQAIQASAKPTKVKKETKKLSATELQDALDEM